MSAIVGWLDNNTPLLKLRIGGVFSDPVEFEAVIDSGFTGFVSMPLIKAFPLGLPLLGTTDVVLADGSRQSKLIALGKVSLDDTIKTGVIMLEPSSSDILIGMDLLRTFSLTLLCNAHGVILLPEAKAPVTTPDAPPPQGPA